MSAAGVGVLDREGSGAAPDSERPAQWNVLTRISFRFCFVYFSLFCVVFSQIILVFAGIAGQQVFPNDIVIQLMTRLSPLTEWVGDHVFNTETPLETNGSGDQAAIWVLVFMMLVVALVSTVVWSLLDRRRLEYATLWRWFLVFIRLCLAGQMFWYGFTKAIPSQMPFPALTTLLTPFGDMPLLGVLWGQVGASPVYESLLGIAEITGGLLLILPRTATLGGMLSLVSMLQVFILNMTYDVPVKILAFHLVLLCLVVLAPQTRRLANVLVLERTSEPATQPLLFRSRGANRIGAAVQVVLGLWILSAAASEGYDAWYDWGGGAEKPELYGIWNVTEFSMDGHQVPPLTTDETRWQRLIFDIEDATSYQRMDDSLEPVLSEVDTVAHTITLSAPQRSMDAAPTRVATFTFDRPAPDRMTLQGELNGRPVSVTLEQQDLDAMPIRADGFHWVQNAPSDH